MTYSLYLLLTLCISFQHSNAFHRYHDYCVVGAGPAGLQMGYFLKRANRDYIVFERYNMTGKFFEKFPRHRILISINKRHTGRTNKEFNFRHDWNSLISDDESLLFRHYSKKMFPHADEMLVYLQDYKERLAISVQFNTEISDIRTTPNDTAPDGVFHLMDDQFGNTYICKVLIIATGMWTPFIPQMMGIELAQGYETLSLDPADYEGKHVLIMGRGNSAFEVAQGIYGVTNTVNMVSRSQARLAWSTHYVGDLRAVNNALLDTYQLKSLDGLSEYDVTDYAIEKWGDKLSLENPLSRNTKSFGRENKAFDIVLRCLGFTFNFSIFSENKTQEGKRRKFPAIKYNYESQTMKGVFFAGANTHSLDYRKSAGGFIHGFRYTARALSRLLSWRYEGEPWPCQSFKMTELRSVLLKRINEASGPYQMFQVLVDVILFPENGDTFDYCEEFPVNLLHKFPQHTGHNASRVLVFNFEYGANFSAPGKDVFDEERASSGPEFAHLANFLHPVLYYYQTLPTYQQMKNRSKKEVLPRPFALHHIAEDFSTDWTKLIQHILPLTDFLEYITGNNLDNALSADCFLEGMVNTTIRQLCEVHYINGQGIDLAKTYYKNLV